MIVPLKKVTILSLGDTEITLKNLANIGVMHIESALGRFNLPKYEKILENIARARKIVKDKSITNSYLNNSIESDLNKLKELIDKEDKLLHRKLFLDEEKLFYNLFGKIELDFIKNLNSKGEKLYFYRFDDEKIVKLMLASQVVNEEICGITNIKISTEKEEELPTMELYDIESEMKSTLDALTLIENEFQKIGNCTEALKNYELDIRNIMLLKEKANATKKITEDMEVYVTIGFIEEKHISDIDKVSRENGWAYSVEKSEEEDSPPVLLKNARPVEDIIYPIYDFMGSWPSPFGKDPSIIFAFFTIFFGSVLIGDAGYGFAIITAVFILRKKFKFPFLYYLGAGCLIWGSLTGTWFGNAWLIVNTPLKHLVVADLSSYDLTTGALNTGIQASMGLMFIFGGIHLTIAKLMSLSKKMSKNIEAIGDVFLIWGIVYAVRVLMAGATNSAVIVPLLATGLALGIIGILFGDGSSLGKVGEILLKPLSLVNGFSDTMSYIRLFAVGFASLIVAMVGSLIAGMTGNIIAGAIIMIMMNTINLSLGMIAILVHAVRLNNLEFANNSGLKLESKRFNPFIIKI